jgi:hypothetical protein
MPTEEQLAALKALVRHLGAQDLLSSLVDEAADTRPEIQIAGEMLTVASRSLPDVPERLLEVLSLHVLRNGFSSDANNLMLISVPRLPRAKADWSADIRGSQKQLQSRAPWAIISNRGGCMIFLPAQGHRFIEVPDRDDDPNETIDATTAHEPSSDVELAVLKSILLTMTSDTLRKLRNHYVHHVSPGELPDTLPGLAEWLGVSRASVYNAVGEFIHYGWMQSQRGRIPVIRATSEIINWWLDKRRHRRMRTIPVAPLYESIPMKIPRIHEWLREQYKPNGDRWAITEWSACALHKKLAVNDISSKPLTISVKDSLRNLMTKWALREVPSDQALFHLQKSPHPITSFSWVTEIDGLPVVDPWEAAIDVVSDPQRGPEQASVICDDLFLAK